MKVLSRAAALLLLVACRNEGVSTATSATATPPAPAADVVTCAPAAHRLCPVDEGASDASFKAFRDALSDAVSRKNEPALLALVDPGIRTDFGGGGGLEDFRKHWKLSSPDSKLWPELSEIFNLGGTFRGEGNDRSFFAPYVYAAWPDSIDAFQHVAATRANVPIRREPAQQAEIVTTVDWEILAANHRSTGWIQVKTSDGKEGWVQESDVRSPVGYRAGFSKRSGAWKMDALVAGD